MRAASLAAVLIVLGVASSAQAESRTAPGPGPITQLLLLDGYRAPAQSARTPTLGGSSKGASAEAQTEETLTDMVQRMWSQVRAYRRPGGAEVLLRGNF